MLVRTDPALTAAIAVAGGAAQLTIALPFATAGNRTRVITSATLPSLLMVVELKVPFSFDGLPTKVNQDVIITISAGGRNFTKIKRLQCYPPPPASSFALAVQIDHTSRSLLVDGRVHSGNGYCINYIGAGAFGGFHNNGLTCEGSSFPFSAFPRC